MNYQEISNIEDVKRAKREILDNINLSTQRFRGDVKQAVYPRDKSLMRSPIGAVRYASYGITAYKSYQAFVQLLKILVGKHKNIQ